LVELSFSAWYEVRRIAFPLRLQGGLLSFWIGPSSQRNQFGSQIQPLLTVHLALPGAGAGSLRCGMLSQIAAGFRLQQGHQVTDLDEELT
jgi:hypothetical protein